MPYYTELMRNTIYLLLVVCLLLPAARAKCATGAQR